MVQQALGIWGHNMHQDNLTKVFDLVPQQPIEIIKAPPPPDDVEADIKKAREIHHDLLDTSKDALQNLLDFAKASESPRAYEVVSNLIKTTSEVAKTLVDLNSARKEETQTQNNTQNNIFVGSTAELQKLIKDGKLDRED